MGKLQEEITVAEIAVHGPSTGRCSELNERGEPCQAPPLIDRDGRCFWHSQDPEIVDQREKVYAEAPGLGGRKRKYVQGTKVDIESLADVLAGLGEVIGNLQMMDQTVGTMNSLIRAYQVASACFLEKEDRERLQVEMDELKRELGIIDD